MTEKMKDEFLAHGKRILALTCEVLGVQFTEGGDEETTPNDFGDTLPGCFEVEEPTHQS